MKVPSFFTTFIVVNSHRMKKLFFCLSFVAGMVSAHAQQDARPQLSAFTRMYLHDVAKTRDKGQQLPGYVYKTINGRMCVSAFIKVKEGFDDAALTALGITTGVNVANLRTVHVPVEQMEAFTRINGIAQIDLDMPVVPYLDNARKATKADSAQKGFSLPSPITGKGVIVGIVDAGFDFNHPTLYDTAHGAYRVKRVWIQKRNGAPPAGFMYGTELTDTNAIRAAAYDTAITSHGTHVAGIAAGSGYGSTNNSKYRGMAYEADMAFVCIMPAPANWSSAGGADMVEGMSYLYNYATSVGKPCVINLSWGGVIGPHDGNSIFSQVCDVLTGPGKIFACSAGNSGEDTLHLGKTFSATDTSVSTFVTFSPYLDSNNQKTWVDIWGDSSHNFCLNVKLYNGLTGIDSTGPICIADTVRSIDIIGSDGDTCHVTVTSVVTEYNGRPHALLSLHNLSHDNVCLTTTATSGTVNMWEGYVLPPTGYYGALKKLGYPWAVSGDARMTSSDFSSTHSAISVGAYTSKASFTNISGANLGYTGAVVGKIAPFSSLGPTVDGRIQPFITGPGFGLASGISSWDTSYNAGGDNYSSVISNTTIGGRTYSYAMAAGTSMSSPATVGIIAMMLQLNPTLNPDSVKSIIAATAITDSYTGTIPAAGNNTWGHGKINAYKALKRIAQASEVKNTLKVDALDCFLYPNPSQGNFTITYQSKAHDLLTVTVSDMTSKVVISQKWVVAAGHNSLDVSLPTLPNGTYFTTLSAGGKEKVIKTILNR